MKFVSLRSPISRMYSQLSTCGSLPPVQLDEPCFISVWIYTVCVRLFFVFSQLFVKLSAYITTTRQEADDIFVLWIKDKICTSFQQFLKIASSIFYGNVYETFDSFLRLYTLTINSLETKQIHAVLLCDISKWNE